MMPVLVALLLLLLILSALLSSRLEDGIKDKSRIKIKNQRISLLLRASLVVMSIPRAASANDLSSGFDAANRLYEQGKFAEAAATYEKLAQSDPGSATLYFNLGNAWFKAGQLGRAIAAWRQAEHFEPREPSLRFNLAFARKKVTGSEAPADSIWDRALKALTVNEWTGLASAALSTWLILLALREWRPAWRTALSGYTGTLGIAAVLLIGCVAAAANQRFRVTAAVVTVSEAIVRIGPLEEAQPTKFQFRDGIELTVLDQKELAVGDQKQLWLYVRDAAGRVGWLKRDQVALIPAATVPRKSNQ